MGLWRWLANKYFEKREYKLNAALSVLANANALYLSETGITVDKETALSISAVFACVRVISEDIASLPLKVYQLQPDGSKKEARDFYLYPILHDSPNSEMTSFELRELLMSHLLLRGNAYCHIVRRNGQVTQLWPLNPDHVEIKRDSRTGILYYQYRSAATNVQFSADEILHFRGLSSDGINGYSVLHLARNAFGLSKATESFGSKFFANDARPGGILSYEGTLSDDARKRLRKQWEETHSGVDRAFKVAVLESGMTWTAIGIPPEDAQFLQTRKFQVNEIARIFRVPPHKIGDLERATFSNISNQDTDYYKSCLRPWLTRLEQRFQRDLLTAGNKNENYIIEHTIDAVLRGDTESRYNAYAVGRQNGWLSANDIRKLENMNPIDGGDVYLVPMNMINAEEISNGGGTSAGSNGVPKIRRSEIRAITASSIHTRNTLRKRYEPLFESAARRFSNRENIALRRAFKKYLQQKDLDGFNRWLIDFYSQFPEYIKRDLLPVVGSFSESIVENALQDAGKEFSDDLKEATKTEAAKFVNVYSLSRHVRSSKGQIRQIITENEDADMLALLNARIDEWEQKRPAKIAKRETVRGDGVFTRLAFGWAGIQAMQWVTQGEKPCPYCLELDGKMVSIDKPFVDKGDFRPESVEVPMAIRSPKLAPPLHDGCVCSLIPA